MNVNHRMTSFGMDLKGKLDSFPYHGQGCHHPMPSNLALNASKVGAFTVNCSLCSDCWRGWRYIWRQEAWISSWKFKALKVSLLTGKHLTSILLGKGVLLASSYFKISVSANNYAVPLSLSTTEIFSSGQCRFEVIGFSSSETSPCSP